MSFYIKAAEILEKVLNKNGSLKSLCFNQDAVDKKRLMATLCHCLEYREALEKIIENSQILKYEKKLNKNLCLLLLNDFLFGKGIQCGGNFKQMILKHKIRLKAELTKLLIKNKVSKKEDLKSQMAKDIAELNQKSPKYMRINRQLISLEEALKFLENENWKIITAPDGWPTPAPPPSCIYADPYIRDLLLFPPKTNLYEHPLYIQGKAVLQDKSSCLSVQCLYSLLPDPNLPFKIIDCCSAPGNKTTQLMSYFINSKIFAFEKDKKRFQTLQKQIVKHGGQNKIQTIQGNFLAIGTKDMKPEIVLPELEKVEYIICDPSCSGSGMLARMDGLIEHESQSQERLENLAAFQVQILTHCLKFSNVKMVVYSTCSIHKEENEMVVHQILKENANWTLANPLPQWPKRGEMIEGMVNNVLAQKMIRCYPSDGMNGFFVAVFQRIL